MGQGIKERQTKWGNIKKGREQEAKQRKESRVN